MNKTNPMRRGVAAMVAGLLLTVGLTHAQYNAWTGHRDIVLNTSATGANVAGDVTKFPVLVRLTNDEAAIITASKPGGADIRFSKADGVTPLPYQIDTWEPWGAAIWVLVDTVKGNNSTQKIIMHYGNPAANSESNGHAVFDTANGFVGVWHLGNAAGASPRPNSVVGAPTAVFRNANVTQQPVRGIIGMADSLTGGPGSDDGTGDEAGLGLHIDLSGGSTTPYAGYSDFTAGIHYSLWVNPNANYANFERFLQMVDDTTYSAANSSATRLMFLRHTASSGTLTMRAAGVTSNPTVSFANHTGVWKQLAFSKPGGDGTPITMYVDGVPFHTYGNSAEIPVSPRQYAWIGRSFDPGNSYLNAKVDAPMLSKVSRSADWIKLSYENQKQANSLANIGLGPDVTGTPYSAWSGHRTITLNTTVSGANVATDVTNFPVLIRLTEAEAPIIAASKANGADIRFSKTDDATPIPYHIESWDSAASMAAIWVKLDTVKGNNSTQAIRMHWGNPAAIDSSNAAAVFDTANGYVAVWHMNGATNETDVTGNGLNAAPTGTVANPVGLIGRARAFSNLENYLTVPGSATGKLNFAATDDYTLSAWVYSSEVIADAATGHAIINKGNNQWLIGIYGNDEPKYYDVMTRGNGSWNQAASNAAGSEITAQTGVNTWRHVVGTWKGSGTPQDTARLFINGVLVNQTVFADIANEGEGRVLTNNVHIGVLGDPTVSRPFVGRIDEVTASKVVRSPAFIKLSFENQKPGNSLVNIGTYVAPTAPGAPTAVTATASTTTTGVIGVSWTAPASNGGSAITSYMVTSTPGNLNCVSVAPTTTCSVSGLTAGTFYTFTVVATNAVGNSVASAPSTAVQAPTSLMPGSFTIRMDGSKPYTYRMPASVAAATEELTMTIVNVHGKRVWSKTINPADTRVNELTWDGRNMSGTKVAAGMYIVRIAAKMNGKTITSEHKGVNLK